MLVKELMTNRVACCTPWDTARTAARLMKERGVGAIPVVSDTCDLLVEGIVSDRHLCGGVVAERKKVQAIKVSELMTPVPVTCEPQYTIEECLELMPENQVRRIPVMDRRGRCVSIVAQADLALGVPAVQVAKMMKEISKPSKPQQHFEDHGFYCGQRHEGEILLLNRRPEREVEVIR